MARDQGSETGPFEAIDSKLTIYALANGMDLVKELGLRVLGWYRDGREREIRIRADSTGGFSLVAAAFKTGDPDQGGTDAWARVASAQALAEDLSALLEEGQKRANDL